MVKIHLKWLEICKTKIRYCSNFIIIIIREAQSKSWQNSLAYSEKY